MIDLLPWVSPDGRLAIVAILMIVGWVVVKAGLYRRAAAGTSSRCLCCGYDLTGAPTLVCSECGHDRAGQAIIRGRRRWHWVGVGLLIAFALPVFVVQRRVREYGWEYYLKYGPLYHVAPPHTEFRGRSGPYLVRITVDRRADQRREATITRGGEVVWRVKGPFLDPDPLGITPLSDVDGDGAAEFFCRSEHGGTGDWPHTYILRLGETVRDLNTPSTSSLLMLEARDLDGDGRPELIGRRIAVYFYAPELRHCGVYVDIAVRVTPAGLRADPALTKRLPNITDDEVKRVFESVRDPRIYTYEKFEPYPMLAYPMVGLIYAGRAAEAYALVERFQPNSDPVKEAFLAEFRRQLAESGDRELLEALGHPPFDSLGVTSSASPATAPARPSR